MPSDHWSESYRGTVFRWEVDSNDHFTVAYYMARFADAATTVLQGLSVAPAPTRDCFIHYSRELRVGDVMYVVSGVMEVEADGLRLGHKMLESTEGALCTTVEHRLAVTLTPEQRRAAEARRVTWDGPERPVRPRPGGLDGFRDTARDVARPTEVEGGDRLALSAAVHRFSAANAHATAAFGLTPGYMRDKNRGFSTFEFQLAFEAGVRAGAPLRVQSALTHVGNSSMRILHVMTNRRSGERVAALEQSGVHLDLDARRPAPCRPTCGSAPSPLLVPAS